MKRNLSTFLLLVLVLFARDPAVSGDLAEGVAAAQRGDFATALREWKPLAEQGDPSAQYNLGIMHDNGRGVPQDYKKAIKWYTLSAGQGHAKAQYNLGWMYKDGHGVFQDDKIAVKWWKLSAQQGLGKAQYNLGWMYKDGHGVLQDNVYTHMWFNIAASLGYKKAVKGRDIIAKRMTSSQLKKAQDLAMQCVKKKYKSC
jgi:TPR repeat protein